MFEIFHPLNEPIYQSAFSNPGAEHAQLLNSAIHKFNLTLANGRITRIWAVIRGKSQRLINLSDHRLKVSGSSYVGIESIAIRKIHGSEGKSAEFDRQFHPLSERSRDRWVSVAMARFLGISLPAVELIQVGQDYFVRDGHHRISVAQALGQEQIDAHVTVWRISGQLPWQAAKLQSTTGLHRQFVRRLSLIRAIQ